MSKTIAEAIQLLDEISENAAQWPSNRVIIKKAVRINQVEALNSLTQQITALTQKFEAFQANESGSQRLEGEVTYGKEAVLEDGVAQDAMNG
ncbi:hypothetical protein KY289_015425 [Solanum tuberosum]|nr:hypothetical protein KY289_015425 [Solanum tuberosum]